MQRERTELFASETGGYDLVIHLDEKPPLDHIETVAGSRTEFWTDFEIADTRKARAKQRRLFFALLHDIVVDKVVPEEFLKEMFYTQFEVRHAGKSISLADNTTSSVTDANDLLDCVIDFMFEWNVPFKEGYEMLDKSESIYLYQCCRHRRCFECGRYADMHHIEAVGSGNNRNKIDHTKRHFMALCRSHHSEIEQIGRTAFSEKYHIPVDGIKLDRETLEKIGVRGNYDTETGQEVGTIK